ncbi:MAG TPA: hypothetical protein PKG60_16265 [Spirochaetota bacterium]|nr:hypothetical protein [Spirochaetota bacterium]HPS86627.1 hypothetical protein [Spirochaetota bacterium]
MRRIYYILTSLVCAVVLLSNNSDCRETNGFSVYLHLEKQKFHNSEDIMLHIQIKNVTDDEISFFIYDSPKRSDLFDKARGDNADYTTFKPVAFDMKGRNAELIVPYIITQKESKETISWMKRREIKLGAGETFMHTQNLKRIYNFEPDKNYRLRLHFFPFIGDAADENKVIVSSNELSFKVINDKAYMPFQPKDPGGVRLTPSEVVLLVLNAEKENQWERSLKYLDIDKYIHSYPDFSRRYDLADDYDKKIIEKDFIRFLVTKKNDYLTDYKILGEEIDNTGLVSYVTVDAARNSMIRTQRMKYVYRLEKNSETDYLWLVSGLEASITKGGKR